MMKVMITNTAGLRRPGAAALDLAYVAAGFYDGFWEVGLNPWDVAAGSLLVLEAGGLIGDLAGDGDYLFGGQVIAANPKIFAQMVATLAPFRTDMQRDRLSAAVQKTLAKSRASAGILTCCRAYAGGMARTASALIIAAANQRALRPVTRPWEHRRCLPIRNRCALLAAIGCIALLCAGSAAAESVANCA